MRAPCVTWHTALSDEANTVLVVHAVVHKVGDPLAFYEIAATVIPVLFLGIVYQVKLVERIHPILRINVAHAAVLVAFAGEFDAFNVLATQYPTSRSEHGVSVALLLLGIVILGQPLVTATEQVDKQYDKIIARLEQEGASVWALRWLRSTKWSRLMLGGLAVCSFVGILNIYGVL
jgi:hypothetical protein